MTKEEKKELLLKDICGRLPYGVRVWYKYETWISKKFATSIRLADEKIALSSKFNKKGDWFPVEEAGEILIKPYLRSISSMTEEEKEELRDTYDWVYSEYPFDDEDEDEDDLRDLRNVEDVGGHYEPSAETYDWYNRKGFDYWGLIPKGLALEAKEGMYN
jgi:hypothetical protein